MRPQLLLAKSYVFTCTSCHSWQGRIPQFWGQDLGKGYQCEKCGCTSVNIREGRPYGSKSKAWEWVKPEFEKLWRFVIPYDMDTVITKPTLEEMRELAKCPECNGTGYNAKSYNCMNCMSTGMIDPDDDAELAVRS